MTEEQADRIIKLLEDIAYSNSNIEMHLLSMDSAYNAQDICDRLDKLISMVSEL